MSRARTVLLALATALACAAMLPTAAGALVVGVGDETTDMFSDPNFQALQIQEARIVVSWDVAVSPAQSWHRAQLSQWLAAAEADQITPMVSFNGDARNIPTVAQYTRAVTAFTRMFPSVRLFTAWNEPDWIYTSVSRHPRLAAGYFNALVRICGCTVIAGDLMSDKLWFLRSYLRTYKRALRYRPAGWALHNYRDVRTHTTGELRTMLANTSGPIWLTEVSGVERRGHWPYPNQNASAAAGDERFLFGLAKRYPRISRIYHYLWRDIPAALWDSGLLGPKGELRPAYFVLRAAIQQR
jgi:hypothetical protein